MNESMNHLRVIRSFIRWAAWQMRNASPSSTVPAEITIYLAKGANHSKAV